MKFQALRFTPMSDILRRLIMMNSIPSSLFLCCHFVYYIFSFADFQLN